MDCWTVVHSIFISRKCWPLKLKRHAKACFAHKSSAVVYNMFKLCDLRDADLARFNEPTPTLALQLAKGVSKETVFQVAIDN